MSKGGSKRDWGYTSYDMDITVCKGIFFLNPFIHNFTSIGKQNHVLSKHRNKNKKIASLIYEKTDL